MGSDCLRPPQPERFLAGFSLRRSARSFVVWNFWVGNLVGVSRRVKCVVDRGKIVKMSAFVSKIKPWLSGNLFVVLLFVVVGFVLYGNVLQNQMFWDDNDFILQNQYVKDWAHFPKYFSENLIAGAGLLSNYWRPALLFVFSLEWRLWGDWSPGYHFVNVSFHIAAAVLLFFVLFRVFKNRWLAFFTALVFLVHPLQTEAVAYVSSLGDSLSAFFMFLGIIFYLKFRVSGQSPVESKSYFLSFLTYVLALMSKETAIVMPAFIFLSDFLFSSQNGERSLKEKLKKPVRAAAPFFVLAGVYILLRATVLNFVDTFNLYGEENIFTSNFHIRLFTFFRVLAVYFGLLFWPLNLHMERSVEIATSLFSPSVVFGGVVFFGLLALALRQSERFPVLSFGVLWFFVGLAPTSNLLVPINGLLYEHWLYLPLVGVFLILVWWGMLIGKRYGVGNVLSGILIAVLVFLSVLTIDRNRDWRDPVTFYNQTLEYAPNSYRVINNLGMAYADENKHERAEKMYKRAISIDPANPVAYHNLGITYRVIGKIDLAEENFKTAISLDPQFVFSYNALANLYLENKNRQETR